MSTLRQAYSVLELPVGAPLNQVHEAYRILKFAWDPSRCPDSNDRLKTKATHKLRTIEAAYQQIQTWLQTHPHSAPQPEMDPPLDRRRCYALLEIPSESSVDTVKVAYRDLAFIWHPDRFPAEDPDVQAKAQSKLQQINTAYDQLKQYLSHIPPRSASPSGASTAARRSQPYNSYQAYYRTRQAQHAPPKPKSLWDEANGGSESALQLLLSEALTTYGLGSQINFQKGHLRVCFYDTQGFGRRYCLASLHLILADFQFSCLTDPVQVYGLNQQGNAWKHRVQAPQPKPESPITRFTFDDFQVNARALPIALGLGLLIHWIPFLQLLHSPLHVLVHQVSHIIVACLGARPNVMVATRASFRVTELYARMDPLTYGLVAIVLVWFFMSARRERLVWAQGLAVGLLVVQAYLTWWVPRDPFLTLFYLAGITGELWLSAGMICGFYHRLPDSIRWDFCRYPMLLVCAPTFVNSLSNWATRVLSGQNGLISVPGRIMTRFWNEDLSRLQLDQSASEWFEAFLLLGLVCSAVILGFYVYFLCRTDPFQLQVSRSRWWIKVVQWRHQT